MKWKIDEAKDLPLAIIEDTENGDGVCEIGERTKRNISDAKLIAAAPDLLEVCEEFLILGQRWGFNKMKLKAQDEFLHLFGKMRELTQKVKGK